MNQHHDHCPDVSVLHNLIAGRLDSEVLARVEAHVISCERCQRIAREYASDQDGILDDLRDLARATADRVPTSITQQADAANEQRARPTTETAPAGGPGTADIAFADARRSTFDSGTTMSAMGDSALDVAVPTQFGRYRIIRKIGQGGMGAVYEAEQDRPRRTVALKVIRAGYATAEMIKRFELESHVLGRLQHPGIAQVHDAGVVDAGHGPQPYFAMEYIRGRGLLQHVAEGKLTTRGRLDLCAKIADAVHHAHSKGVIHRDLKPGNILVTEDGQPKVLDFGVARATDSDVQLTTMQTDAGMLIGTLPYMSPEQVSGDPEQLDTRSDVYALGVMLYEVLTGRLPYDISRKMLLEAVRIIREEEPTRLSQVSGGTGTAGRELRGDVETIVGKALEKEKDRRYASANALAMDIRRYLNDEPISARRPSASYQFAKFAKRNKALVGGLAATLVMLLAGLAGTGLALKRALAAEAEQTKQRLRADERADAAQQAEAAAGAARDAEKERADQLKQVSDFQSQMLSQIDTTNAGVQLMADVRERFAAALEKDGVPEAERKTRVDALWRELVRVNATDTAAAMVDRTILKPAVETINRQFKDQPVIDAQLRQALAVLYQTIGLYDAALPLQESALATRRRVLGEEHPDTLSSGNNMGMLLEARGELGDAEVYLRDALEQRRLVLGENASETIESINNLGFLLIAQGKRVEAEPYYREALEKRRRTLGEEHPDTLVSINNMGYLLVSTGRLAEAEPYYREALAKMHRVLGPEHPHTLVSINNMGYLLDSLGRLSEAEAYYRDALEKRRRVLGEEHPDTIESINNMGALLDAQGRVSEAEAYYREALEKRRRVLGEEHPETLTSISNMGFLLQTQGRLSEAESYLREALEKRRRGLGEAHPDTIQSMSNMGSLLYDQGKLTEAEAYCRAALEMCRRELGEDHPETIMSINNLGALLQTQGKHSEAEPYYREALEKYRRVLGEKHPDTLTCGKSLGSLLWGLGRFSEAIDLLALTEPAAREAFTGGNVRLLASFLAELGRARVGLGFDADRFQLAESNLLEAHPIYVETRGETHNFTLNCVQSIVELYTAWHTAEPGKGYDAKAAEWRGKLAEWQATTRPASNRTALPG